MPHVLDYHRPDSIDAALQLLGRPGVTSRVLAGGTDLIGSGLHGAFEAVDLQNTGLNRIDAGPDRAVIGAMATLDDLARHDQLPGGVRDAARRELSSTLRTLATLGGSLAMADAESELLATLLVHDPVVAVHGLDGRVEIPLPQLWADRTVLAGRLITGVSIATDGVTASERTARTSADRPIVAVVGRRGHDGRVRLAASGVADVPLLIGDPGSLVPPGDFRGSSDYRRHVATTLTRRVMEVLG